MSLAGLEVFPGIFSTVKPDELPHAVVINEDGTINTEANPAPIGSVIRLYATGLGPVSDSGEMATPFQLSMAGAASDTLPAELLSAKPAPGFPPGVVEVLARIPRNASVLSSWIAIGYADRWSGVSTSAQVWLVRWARLGRGREQHSVTGPMVLESEHGLQSPGAATTMSGCR